MFDIFATILSAGVVISVVTLVVHEPMLLAAGISTILGLMFVLLPAFVAMVPVLSYLLILIGLISLGYGVLSARSWLNVLHARRAAALARRRAAAASRVQDRGLDRDDSELRRAAPLGGFGGAGASATAAAMAGAGSRDLDDDLAPMDTRPGYYRELSSRRDEPASTGGLGRLGRGLARPADRTSRDDWADVDDGWSRPRAEERLGRTKLDQPPSRPRAEEPAEPSRKDTPAESTGRTPVEPPRLEADDEVDEFALPKVAPPRPEPVARVIAPATPPVAVAVAVAPVAVAPVVAPRPPVAVAAPEPAAPPKPPAQPLSRGAERIQRIKAEARQKLPARRSRPAPAVAAPPTAPVASAPPTRAPAPSPVAPPVPPPVPTPPPVAMEAAIAATGPVVPTAAAAGPEAAPASAAQPLEQRDQKRKQLQRDLLELDLLDFDPAGVVEVEESEAEARTSRRGPGKTGDKPNAPGPIKTFVARLARRR